MKCVELVWDGINHFECGCTYPVWGPAPNHVKADAILALIQSDRDDAEAIRKAAYLEGWNDREADILERCERIAPSTTEGVSAAPSRSGEGNG